MRYLITLSHSRKPGSWVQRWVTRDSDDDAVESAKRLIRLKHRAAGGAIAPYDMWTVAKWSGTGPTKRVAHGTLE